MRGEYSFVSERLKYRSIQESDTDILALWRSNPAIIKYYYNPNPITREAHLDWYKNSYLNDTSRLDFLVLDKTNPVGFAALTHIDLEKHVCEINYTIGTPDYTGCGLSVEMINAVCGFGYTEFQLSEFIAMIHKDNTVSHRAALSAGFLLTNSDNTFWAYRRRIDLWLPM